MVWYQKSKPDLFRSDGSCVNEGTSNLANRTAWESWLRSGEWLTDEKRGPLEARMQEGEPTISPKCRAREMRSDFWLRQELTRRRSKWKTKLTICPRDRWSTTSQRTLSWVDLYKPLGYEISKKQSHWPDRGVLIVLTRLSGVGLNTEGLRDSDRDQKRMAEKVRKFNPLNVSDTKRTTMRNHLFPIQVNRRLNNARTLQNLITGELLRITWQLIPNKPPYLPHLMIFMGENYNCWIRKNRQRRKGRRFD